MLSRVSESENNQIIAKPNNSPIRSISKIIVSSSLFIFVFTLGIYTLSLNGLWGTDHATSFLQLDWAILKNHSFALGSFGQFVPHSVDDFLYKGNYYSALAPGTAVMALPIVAIGFALNGSSFSIFGYPMIFSEFFIAIVASIGAVLVFKIAKMFFGESTSLFLAFAYAFSTIAWPFATFFFQSDPSATLDLLVAFLALRIGKENRRGMASFVSCGLAIAAALTVDYVNAILMPIILVYFVISLRQTQNTHSQTRFDLITKLLGFALACGEGILLIGAYNYLNFGNFFASTEQMYLGSSAFFGNFGYPLYLGIVLNLFTPFRGLFFYCPILVIGAFGMYIMFRKDKQAGLFLALFLGLLLPYSAWYDPTGGLSYGPRFIVPAIPFLLIPGGFFLDSNRSIKRNNWRVLLTYSLYALGVAMNGIAAITSALGPANGPWIMSPFFNSIGTSSTLSNFLSGLVDAWSSRSFGSNWWIISGFVILMALFLPLFLHTRFLHKKPPTIL